MLLEENKAAWASEFPDWIDGLLEGLSNCSAVPNLFPLDQFKSVSDAFKKYILSGNLGALAAYSLLACFDEVQQQLLADGDLYNALKNNISNSAVLQFFYNVSRDEGWQKKLLEDRPLIFSLLSLPDDEDVWDLFVNLAYNKDAKDLLPKEVLIQANKSEYSRCADLCALLCNDIDLNSLKLNDAWIENTVKLLGSLLTDGQVSANGIHYDLLDLVLPIANFSTIYSKQDALGKRVIPLLLKVIADDLPQTFPIQGNINRARAEAASALWNLAYTDGNRALITAENGAARLKTALAKVNDNKLQSSIEGVLYMLTTPLTAPPPPPPAVSEPIQGHVMLSYNWGSQPVVKKLAQDLKDLGYSVWLDLDQMKGDTLEAMANAIEKSDIVLICMSQKYKDSANCRCNNNKNNHHNVEQDRQNIEQENASTNIARLGLTLGTRLYHDFSDEKDWEAKVAALVKEIGDRGKGSSAHRSVSGWGIKEIHEWMKSEQLEQHFEEFKKQKIDGKALLELKSFFVPQNPLFFSVGEKFKITEMGELLRLSAAIGKLN